MFLSLSIVPFFPIIHIKVAHLGIIVSQILGDVEIPLMEHIKELRRRMMLVAAVLVFTLLMTFPFSEELASLIWDDLIPQKVNLVAYNPLEWMVTKLWLSLIIAAIAGIPLFVYELFAFMKKGLFPNERKFFLTIVPTSLILFLIGASIAYYLAIPLIFNYMIFYSEGVATSALSIRDTFSMISSLIIVFGIIFQFPMFVIFAIKSDLIKREQLKTKRIYVYGILIGFAIFVTPDITGMSQLIMAFLLVILFEFSLLITRFI